MKTSVKYLGITLFTLGSVFIGCTKDEIKPMEPELATPTSKTIDMSSTKPYSVSLLYVQSTTDMEKKNEADQFKGWKVYFLPDGTITADNGVEKVNGKWVKIKGDYNEEIIAIDFGQNKKFAPLSHKWMVVEQKPAYYSFQSKDINNITSEVVFEM